MHCLTNRETARTAAGLVLTLRVTVGGQPELSTVPFFYHFFSGLSPASGSAVGARVVVVGGGFVVGTPRLTLGPTVVTGTIVNNSQLAFTVALPVAAGTAELFAPQVSLNAADIPTLVGNFTAYRTAVTNATAVSGPASGGTALDLHGEALVFSAPWHAGLSP